MGIKVGINAIIANSVCMWKSRLVIDALCERTFRTESVFFRNISQI